MDKDGIEVFDGIMKKKGAKYLENFPQGKYEDRISELVWGVRSKTCNPCHIHSFAIENIKNSHRLMTRGILVNLDWKDYYNGILKNPGLMCEYFMVDYLSRNSHTYEKYKNKRFKFIHKKGTPEQDEDFKIDFLTTMTNRNEIGKIASINFGVQLSTSKSRAEFSKKRMNGLDWIGYKKGDIFRTSKKIDENLVDNFPVSYIPNTMCLFVINGSINEFINVDNINIFSNAFRTWENEGFLPGGPTQYLSDIVKKDFEMVSDGYHLGLEIFYKLIPKVLSNNRDFKNIDKYDNFDILFDYNADKRELKLDYFLKNGNFIMSLFFILNKDIIAKFGE